MPKKEEPVGALPPVNDPDSGLAEPKTPPSGAPIEEHETVDIKSWPTTPLRIGTVDVNLQESSIGRTNAQALWAAIHKSTLATSFSIYEKFVNSVLCVKAGEQPKISPQPLNEIDGYKILKAATEVFLIE